jgi:hypothetical protein
MMTMIETSEETSSSVFTSKLSVIFASVDMDKVELIVLSEPVLLPQSNFQQCAMSLL